MKKGRTEMKEAMTGSKDVIIGEGLKILGRRPAS